MQRRLIGGGLCTVLVVTLLAGATFAQQPGGRGRGGPGGRGGFGGTNLGTLLGNEAVQKELGLEGAALDKAKAVREEYQTELRAAMGDADFQGLRDLPEAERAAKMAEFRTKATAAAAKVATAMKPKIKESLSSQQYERLQQIQWQAAGIQALSDAEVVALLEINKEQTEKLAALQKEYAEDAREIFEGGFEEGDREKLAELTKERDEKANEILTAAQREKFTTLKGKEFDVSLLRGQGGNRPGGRPEGGRPEGRRPGNRPAGDDSKT